MIWEKIRSRLGVGKSQVDGLPEELGNIMNALVEHTYYYISKYNIQKLQKSDKRILEYIDLIFARCFVDVMAGYDEATFMREPKETQEAELSIKSNDKVPTSAQQKILHYIEIVNPNLKP